MNLVPYELERLSQSFNSDIKIDARPISLNDVGRLHTVYATISNRLEQEKTI